MNAREIAVVRRKWLLIGALLALAAILYIASLVIIKAVVFGEETFPSSTMGNVLPLNVYADVQAIDPLRQSMDLRFDVATGSGPHGTQYNGTLQRDIELHVGDGYTEQVFRFGRNAPMSSRLFVAGVQGAVSGYPFDRYATRIVLSARELSAKNGSAAIPIRVTVWEGVPAWALSVVKLRESPHELALAFAAHRPQTVVFFSCVLYGLMVLIAASALTIGALIFIGLRQVEATLVSALAAMVFALPVLRNLLPGGPPLGVLADIFVLLWAELAVATGLTLLVIAWAKRGSNA